MGSDRKTIIVDRSGGNLIPLKHRKEVSRLERGVELLFLCTGRSYSPETLLGDVLFTSVNGFGLFKCKQIHIQIILLIITIGLGRQEK